VPSRTAAVRVAVLLNASSSLPMALLFRAVFERANRKLGAQRYRVALVSSRSGSRLSAPDVTVTARLPRGRCDYLVVPPYEGIEPGWRPDPADVALIRRQHARGAVVASSCLGALTLAEAGLLDTREATTHWSWTSYVRGRYPRVAWNTRRIVCDQGAVITAGGYLATVDLALHIIAATSSRATAHELGRAMLADSARQHQSIYALRLAEPAASGGQLRDLEDWLDHRLQAAPTARKMAGHCNMSLRSFHRKFREAYGVTPRKYLQLKRVEAVRQLLGESRRSIEQILSDVGVSDVTSFRRIFQRELGHSPAEFRRRLSG
jgi:transcriptional regulator GlxA family with amidase domain